MDGGGELAVQLRRLYDYFDRRLQESNRKKEATGILETINRLSVLRDAWAAMLEGGKTLPLTDSSSEKLAAA